MIKTKIPHQVAIGARMEERIPQEHLSVARKGSEAVAETKNKKAEMWVKCQDMPTKARVQKG